MSISAEVQLKNVEQFLLPQCSTFKFYRTCPPPESGRDGAGDVSFIYSSFKSVAAGEDNIDFHR